MRPEDPDDGGSAFPNLEYRKEVGPNLYSTQQISSGGMSLRDYFAAAAMKSPDCPFNSHDANQRAEWAYKQADAMLQARKA